MDIYFLKNKARTFKYLALLCAFALIICALIMFVYTDAYYTCCSDDLLQYYKILEDFTIKLKSGNLSFYAFNNYLGASFFADTYYIPLDIFTFITTILSFFMNFEVAFGFTEMIKLFAGTMMFAYFLSLRKCSNKAIFLVSLIYFACGYNTIMMAFSAFFSLAFYFPFAAVAIEKFKEGKKLFISICVATLIFYNFYLGCCTMLFMGVYFILSYILDNKLIDVKNELSLANQDIKHLKSKAFWLYIGRMFKSGFTCIFYMVVGFMITAIVLLPSLGHFMIDSFSRSGDNFYKWSFNSKYPYETVIAKDIYSRIISEFVTPTYSCSFYAFNNNYITDHFSLYITVSGIMMMLYVFSLKDRDSWIYKIFLFIEGIMLAFPIFYMLFSLNSIPYTRWIGLLNFINLLIVAHVITKTDLKFKFANIWSIVRSLLLITCLIIVLNYFAERLYGENIIHFLLNDDSKEKFTGSAFAELENDMIFIGVAIGIIVVLTIGSIEKINKKFDITPYALCVEIIVSFGYMFVPKFGNYYCMTLSNDKEVLNAYLSAYLENPYDTNFSRTHVYTYLTSDFVYSDNYSRTNQYLSDLRIFHSFYDASANDFAELMYDRGSKSSEERNSKEVINQYSLFVHQLLATRYVVVDSQEGSSYFPEEYFDLIIDNGEYAFYENKNYQPFMVYDSALTSYLTFKSTDNQLTKQQYLLNAVKLSDDSNYYGMNVINTYSSSVKKEYSQENGNYAFDDSNDEYYIYNISTESYNNISGIPTKGIMHYYYDYGGTRCVEFRNVYIEYADGSLVEGLDGYAFYDEIPTRIYIGRDSVGDLSEDSMTLEIEYTDYSEYDKYISRMENYNDLSLKIDGASVHVSYSRTEKDKTNVVALPIAYNGNWTIDTDYEIINVNGGFLGIVVPSGESDINFTMTYKPKYIKEGALISIVGIIAFGSIVFIDWRRRKNEEDFNYCSLL